ncbi:hypothetical protein QTP70_019243 [Hemibagrus guttatus]|uniref:Histamine N-methyltransferase n=1 Tax=Hemibagrus guttatus TaxID=175788 RepID=A0AAE0PPN4_9TELE|nr:hypothetical protein QTP70_019243 [Hemibagrus guttatus]
MLYSHHTCSDLVAKTLGLDHITFRFNKMTASEVESDWKQRNTDRKLDFIHMIQMLYYVTDPEAMVSFFRSLLNKDGKLLIILVSGIPYQSHTLPSQMDITECFTAGDEKGELLLDFLTEVLEFSKNASPELKAGVLELLKHPECSREVDGRIIFNNNLEALVLTP